MKYLDFNSQVLLIASFVLGFLSITLFILEKVRPALLSLVFSSLLLGILFASVDPFLHLWDEQFHALVSKNLTKHFLKPTLYDNPVLDYDYKVWSGNHVWLHKQPLFMWQMALSQLLFGYNEMAIRIPSALMHALLTLIIFDIGRLVKNQGVGFVSALFFTFLNYPLDLVSGMKGLDHNDFAFMFYISCSFWAFFRYRRSQKKFWPIVIGIFVGCAILTKWLPGLLVFLAWGVVHVYEQKTLKNIIVNSKPILLSLATSLIVFLPWQVYCLLTYPDEFNHEMIFNAMHVSSAMEGHEGDWTFHIKSLNTLYGEGEIVPIILLISFAYFLYDKKVRQSDKIAGAVSILFVYVFFSLVKTKMTAFPVIVLPLVVLTIGNFIYEMICFIKISWANKVVLGITSALIAFLFFDLNLMLKIHTLEYKIVENGYRHNDILAMGNIRRIKEDIADPKTVIFNAQELGALKIMFYTDLVAYDFIPSEEQYHALQEKGYKAAILKSSKLPAFIEKDSSFLKLNYPSVGISKN